MGIEAGAQNPSADTKAYGCLFTFLYFLWPLSVMAQDIQLDLPIQCEIGKACFIQNYYDHADGKSYKDYRCGHLTYDNHQATDFRVIDEEAMRNGVPVLAAATGRVLGTRDGEPDIAISIRGMDKTSGKEAGNGVVLTHHDGWQTQYSHLRNGSIAVKTGDWVTKGQIIGLVGESGNADFPHVDFIVRRNGKAVDPFAPGGRQSCSLDSSAASLWSPSARKSVPYIATALLQLGFSEKIPQRLEAQTGTWAKGKLFSNTPQWVVWAEVMGANSGDTWHFDVLSPSGQRIAEGGGEVTGDKAIIVVGTGKRLRTGSWPTGHYQALFTLTRAGKPLLSASTTLILESPPQ